MMELTDEEKKNIKSIVNISKLLLNDINKLKSLEINGDNNNDYSRIVDDIKFHLSLENFLYECFGNELDKIYTVLECFFSNNDGVSVINELQIVKSDNEHNLVKRRIAAKLCQIRIKTIHEIYKNSKNQALKESIKTLDITSSIDNDLINTIMVMLDDLIKDDKYNDIKDRLISLKYNMDYINPIILNEFLNNKFTINKELYWGHYVCSKLTGLDNELLKFYKSIYVENFDDVFSYSILNYTNESSKEEYSEAIISQLYMRAVLLFLDENDLKSIKEVTEQRINLERELTNNSDVGSLLLDTYNKYEKDKELPQMVLMR